VNSVTDGCPQVEITQVAVMDKAAFVTARVQVTDRPSRGALLLVKAKDGWKVFAVAMED
jgi:hypothetical protein